MNRCADDSPIVLTRATGSSEMTVRFAAHPPRETPGRLSLDLQLLDGLREISAAWLGVKPRGVEVLVTK